MKKSLLIIGAGIYGLVAKEIAEEMGVYGQISFLDDSAQEAPDGTPVTGTTKEVSCKCADVVVAIGNAKVRQSLIRRIQEETQLQLAALISPKAQVSRSAKIGKGCIIEPMAVVHTGCVQGEGCFVCAGAVVNHAAVCGDCVQVDCNATVRGNTTVPSGCKIASGTVY